MQLTVHFATGLFLYFVSQYGLSEGPAWGMFLPLCNFYNFFSNIFAAFVGFDGGSVAGVFSPIVRPPDCRGCVDARYVTCVGYCWLLVVCMTIEMPLATRYTHTHTHTTQMHTFTARRAKAHTCILHTAVLWSSMWNSLCDYVRSIFANAACFALYRICCAKSHSNRPVEELLWA